MSDVFRALQFPPTLQKPECVDNKVWMCEWKCVSWDNKPSRACSRPETDGIGSSTKILILNKQGGWKNTVN